MIALRPFDPWAHASDKAQFAAGRCRSSPTPEPAQPWTHDDWLALFDERAGIAEFDGGASRDEAEAMALDACVTQWLAMTPLEAAATGRCVHCHQPALGSDTLTLIIAGDTHHLHAACALAFAQTRRDDARAAVLSILDGKAR